MYTNTAGSHCFSQVLSTIVYSIARKKTCESTVMLFSWAKLAVNASAATTWLASYNSKYRLTDMLIVCKFTPYQKVSHFEHYDNTWWLMMRAWFPSLIKRNNMDSGVGFYGEKNVFIAVTGPWLVMGKQC